MPTIRLGRIARNQPSVAIATCRTAGLFRRKDWSRRPAHQAENRPIAEAPKAGRPERRASRRQHAKLATRACRLVERGAKTFGEFDGVVIGPEVHEDDARFRG